MVDHEEYYEIDPGMFERARRSMCDHRGLPLAVNSGSRRRARRLPPSGTCPRMRMNPCFLVIALALATPAFAQPAGQAENPGCNPGEAAAIEQDMDLARSKGQMLRRRQLAEALAALQTRCKTLAPEQSRAADIERLEREIRELSTALEQAQAQLRKLKSEAL